ncbi:TetR/AcrR family transcriptional regulator [Gandjariella thermophila]|uniref:TetR family transcriptional regulator n=1 Tax=Gandjariella thermophila TaxID=1931992 RepID=A0A4D4JFG8_9PSEU|nr:TetR/AcrR family transcriptional regulator [Gandjariella thermophila]GDY33069.1 TetR family transcriptional regulator [Gandjariella thermophila]
MRTRLSTQERREQLLAIGTELFASRPYDEVWIEEVAEIAQVSRGLLYHYFATKRDFFAAVVRSEADQLLRITEPDPSLPLTEQLTRGLDAYLGYVEQRRDGYRVLHRAAVAVDEGIRRICEDNIGVQQRRILAALSREMEVTPATGIAVRGWLTFVVGVCLDWLERRSIPREELRDMCARTLLAAVNLDPETGTVREPRR